jgi:hypothetical protein
LLGTFRAGDWRRFGLRNLAGGDDHGADFITGSEVVVKEGIASVVI